MRNLLSFDPGLQTGIAVGTYEFDQPYELVDYWQVPNGLDGFLDWLKEHRRDFSLDPDITIVSEKFVLRSQRFVADTTPLLIEGAMRALEMNPVFQLRTDKVLVPDRILKENGLWVSAKYVQHTDGRDANDAIIHALAYLFKQKHKPTLKRYFGGENVPEA